MIMDDAIENLVAEFSKFPGIGRRTALRLVLHMVKNTKSSMYSLSDSLVKAADNIRECSLCYMLTSEEKLCKTCQSPLRKANLLCVVANVQDLVAIESTCEYKGLYHVLHGVLAPIDNIGPFDLNIEELCHRLKKDDNLIEEVIIATPPSIEGEATALYIGEQISSLGLKISRIASGIPVGSDLQFTDRLTLSRALFLRRDI